MPTTPVELDAEELRALNLWHQWRAEFCRTTKDVDTAMRHDDRALELEVIAGLAA